MARAIAPPSGPRSPLEWIVRGAIAATGLVLGYVSTAQSLALSLSSKDAERAHVLAPSDGRVTAELAELLAVRQGDASSQARTTRLAREALGNEPLAVQALVALALETQLRGGTTQARRLFLHSNALSRRELGTQLWLIEDAVGRGDVTSALRNYDIALRTAKSAPDLLFPVLSNAIADPAIAAALAKTLAAQAPWSDAFINYLAGLTKHAEAIPPFFQCASKLGVAISPVARSTLVNTLVAKGSFDDGWKYYSLIRPRAARTISRDPSFDAELESPSVFDWVPVINDSGVNATLQRTSQGGLFDFAVPATVGGVILQQVQLLTPGRYKLDGISSGINQDRTMRPYWQLTCLSGRDLGRIALPNSSENGGRFVGEFKFDGKCSAQSLRLVAQPSLATGGTTGQIRYARLTLIESTR